MDRSTGRGKGYGFVTFDATPAVDAVMRTSDHALQGKPVEVSCLAGERTRGQQGKPVEAAPFPLPRAPWWPGEGPPEAPWCAQRVRRRARVAVRSAARVRGRAPCCPRGVGHGIPAVRAAVAVRARRAVRHGPCGMGGVSVLSPLRAVKLGESPCVPPRLKMPARGAAGRGDAGHGPQAG